MQNFFDNFPPYGKTNAQGGSAKAAGQLQEAQRALLVMLMYLKMDECTLTLSVLSLHPVVHSSWDYSLALKSKHPPSCLGIPHYIHTDTQTHTHTGVV